MNKQFATATAIIALVILIAIFYFWYTHSRANEAAQRELINAVIACGGDVAHHVREAESFAASQPSMSYPQALDVYKATLASKCK